VEVQGIGGQVKATPERVAAWAVGSVRLVPEDVIVPSQSLAFQSQGVDGLVGAEVLSQFRAITIDWRDGTLAVDQVPVI